MINMKYEAQEVKDFSTPRAMPEVPKYPHGLKLRLGPEELKKLGFKEPPPIEKKYNLSATVEVVEIEADKEAGDESSYSLCLQITEMELKSGEKEETSTPTSFYGE